MLYLYAIADEPVDVHGIAAAHGETALVAIAAHGLFVIAGVVEAGPPLSRRALASQDGVVRALHACVPALLPMRFASTAADEDALTASLRTRSTTLKARLAEVRGREQMTLRILGSAHGLDAGEPTPGTSADDPAGAGARYLAARRAMAVPPPIRPLMDALSPLQRATRVEAGRHPGVVATVYQLIDRGSSGRYIAVAHAEAARLAPLVVRITGPSPAYAFG